MSKHANYSTSHRMLLVINATNTAEMDGATSSLAVSCEDSSMIGTINAASEQMSAQHRIPSSLRAALDFVAAHTTVGHPTLGRQEQMPMSVQGCLPLSLKASLNFACTGVKENPIVIEDEQDEEKSSNYVEKHNSYVYKRRKLQGNSVTLLPKQIQTDAGKDCLPNDMLSRRAQVENFPECREDINYCNASLSTFHRGYSGNFSSSGKDQINCNSNRISDGEMCNASARTNVDYKGLDSEEISLYHKASSRLIVNGGKMKLNIVEVGEASSGSRSVIEDSTCLQVQSSSSFEMSDCNLGQTAVSVKHELTELAECTSTADVTHQSQENDPEKEWCVSVLKQCGLLGQFVSLREYGPVGHPGVVGDGSCPQVCKICSSLEDSTTTLICDLCDEAFHMSCCNPKVKSAPTQDDWYCQFCRKIRKKPGKKSLSESKSARNAAKETCRNFEKSTQNKGDFFSRMLENSEPYTTQVRIGKAFQADVPDSIGNVLNDAEMLYLGEPLEKEFPEHNLINELWSKGWQSARSFFPGSMENWLQCQNVVCVDGTCSDDEKTKDIICGKWRRAPLSQVQNDEWDCSCAVVWDPVRADCAVPQELKTEDIMMRLKATETAKPQLVYKKRKSKMKHCIAEEGQIRIEGTTPL